jgi:hypothetical protein
MRGSKLLIISIFVLTVIVGGVAIWVGLRLSKEEEEPTITITEEEGEEEEEEDEEVESALADFEGLGVTLPETGDPSNCWELSDATYDECGYDVTIQSYHEDAGDNINVCFRLINNASKSVKNIRFNQIEMDYCPGNDSSSCVGDPPPGCHGENGGDRLYEDVNGNISSGQTYTYCKEISKAAECGIVQWDLHDSNHNTDLDCNIGQGSPPEGDIILAWLYDMGDYCPMNCEDLDASPATLTTSGGDVSLTTTIDDYWNAVSGYTYGTDEGTISGSSDSATWTVPSGVSEGIYSAWVLVEGGTGDSSVDVQDSGCISATSCTAGSEGCVISVDVQDEPPTGEPSFNAEKTASITCINDNTAARATYNIRVWNSSTVIGTILSVEDTYDSRFQSTWISSITPQPDLHDDGTITWNNDSDGWELEAGEEITFSYTVTIPSTYLSEGGSEYEFRNVVVVTPEVGDDIEREAEVSITCAPGVPSTGILDDTSKSLLLGLILIIAGLGILKGQSILYKTLLVRSKKDKFEKRVLDSADRDLT